MKNEELQALGLDKNTIKKIQRIHAEDVKKLHQKRKQNHGEKIKQYKDAIGKVIDLLEELTSLRWILGTTTHYYHKELSALKEAENSQKRGENMAYYTKCPYCGNNLDPGEKCDCQTEPETVRKENREETEENEK